MVFQFQNPDYGFIAQAGQDVAKVITAVDIAKKKNIDDKQAEDAHQMLIDQAKTLYKEATGVPDEVKATAFAVRYFQPKFKNETALEAIGRWEKADTQFKTALNTLKVKGFHETVSGGQKVQQEPQAAGGTMAMKQEGTPEQARTARLSGQMAPTTEMARPAGFGYGEAPGDRPPSVETPPMSPQDRYALAQKQGILEDKTVYADIAKSGREDLAAQQFPTGTTAEQVYQKEMQIPVSDEMSQKYHTQFPTQKDVMTNERLTIQSNQRARLADMANRLREKKLGLDAKKQNKTEEYKLLENQIDLINTQIRASEAVTKTALGISTGKDILGSTTFYTGPEIDIIQKDNESTLQSAQDLLERVNKKNEGIIPPLPIKPPAKSQFKIVEVR